LAALQSDSDLTEAFLPLANHLIRIKDSCRSLLPVVIVPVAALYKMQSLLYSFIHGEIL
jgi:hypothetical protein